MPKASILTKKGKVIVFKKPSYFSRPRYTLWEVVGSQVIVTSVILNFVWDYALWQALVSCFLYLFLAGLHLANYTQYKLFNRIKNHPKVLITLDNFKNLPYEN